LGLILISGVAQVDESEMAEMDAKIVLLRNETEMPLEVVRIALSTFNWDYDAALDTILNPTPEPVVEPEAPPSPRALAQAPPPVIGSPSDLLDVDSESDDEVEHVPNGLYHSSDDEDSLESHHEDDDEWE